MSGHADAAVTRVFEQSALVRTIERGGRAVAAAASRSRLIAAGREWYSAAAVRLGHLLLAATITHIVLMLVIAQPFSWLWLILPSIVAAIGVILVLTSRPVRMEP